MEAKEKQLNDAASGLTDPTSSSKGAWQQAMSSGWWEPIPAAGCQPIDSNLGRFTWHFDMCPTAAKISEIGAYGLWITLIIGTFVMLTGGRKEE